MAGADAAIGRSASPLGNPATLQNDSAKEVCLSYADYFENTYSTSSLSFIGPIDSRSSVGVSVGYVLVPDIEIHPASDTVVPANVATQSSSDLLFRISYGRKMAKLGDRFELSAGGAINAERRDLVGWTGYGIGADAGLDVSGFIESIHSSVAGCLLVENITTTVTDWSSDYKEYAYPHCRIGLAWQKELDYLYGKISISYLSHDLLKNEGINSSVDDSTPASDLSARIGGEFTIMNVLSFRIGYTNGAWTFGGGLRLFNNRAGIDFAYLNNDLASTYKIGVNYKWF